MPLYEYITTDPEKGCRICRKGFELRRPLDRPALEVCPLCRNPVKKLVSRGVTSPQITKPLSVSDAKKAGFTVLEKRDQGTYEKL
ncbi:MAG: zinc ribbon domain-containing protein [Verrucomicrobia bacterium]|jgi:putative FmdB family regulatory protein|nr:zinc ribbon domain-containing protein [Verrucomicrobiota bacterium]